MIESIKVDGRIYQGYVRGDGEMLVRTPFCDHIPNVLKNIGGRWDRDRQAWSLPTSAETRLIELFGSADSDWVNVTMTGYDVYEDGDGHLDNPRKTGKTDACGGYVLAYRNRRDEAAHVYAAVVDGEIPASGGSQRDPYVESQGVTYQIAVRRDFAERRNLPIVGEAGTPESGLSNVSDETLIAEARRRGLI